MTHADAFLQDILAQPDDDAPRLIYADWLEEQCEASSIARAELIRVQCALARGKLPLRQKMKLEDRQYQILEEWDQQWCRPIRRLARDWEYHRGFIESIGMMADQLSRNASRLFRRLPIRRLHLWPRMYPQSYPNAERINMAELAENAYLGRLRALDLSFNQLESRDVQSLVVSEHLTNLKELNLALNRIGDGGIRALAGSPLLGRLECLDLSGNDIGARGLRALAEALDRLENSTEGLRLQRLKLSYAHLSAAGQRVIADSPLLWRLVRS